MMMKKDSRRRFSSFVVLLLVLIGWVITSEKRFIEGQVNLCSRNHVQSVINRFQEILQKYDSQNAFQSATTYALDFADIALRLAPCLLVGSTFYSGTRRVDIQVRTNRCFYDPSSDAWKNDVCCNPELQARQCCAPRIVTFQRNAPGQFTNIMRNSCRNPSKIEALVSQYLKLEFTSNAACRSAFDTRIQETLDLVQNMYQCLQDFVSENIHCGADSDCHSGTCNPRTATCVVRGFEFDKESTSLAQCVRTSVSSFILRGLQLQLALTGDNANIKDFSDKLQEHISRDRCVNALGIVQTSLTTQAQCENSKRCTDGTNNCANDEHFCGFDCNRQGICTPLNAIQSEQICNSLGRCFENYQALPNAMSRDDCESKSVCIGAAADCSNCDQNKETCEVSGRCIGFPGAFIQGKSQICTRAVTSGTNCPLGFTFAPILNTCINLQHTDTQCASVQGQMTAIPKSREACESYKWCRETNGKINMKNEADCVTCGGTVVDRFRWVPAVYRPRYFQQLATWKRRQMVNQYRWVQTLDLQKYLEFLRISLSRNFGPLLKSVLQCRFGPLLQFWRIIACDCSGSSSGTDCFEQELKSDIGALIAYSGIRHKYELVDVSVETKETSVTDPSQEIAVVKTELILEASAQRSLLSDTSNVSSSSSTADVKQGENVVGKVVGDGYQLSKATSDTVTLCIRRDPERSANSNTYPQPSFAVKQGNTFQVANVMIVNQGNADVEICGEVKDTQTYYPAFITKRAADERDQKVRSAAPTTSLNYWALCIMIIASILLVF